MKKLLYLFSAVAMLALAACGSNSKEAESIYGKIQAGEEITQEDCHHMIGYLEKPLTEAVEIMKDCKNVTEVQEKFTKLSEKYPFVQPFTQYLASHYYDLDSDNQKEFQEVQQKLQNILNK